MRIRHPSSIKNTNSQILIEAAQKMGIQVELLDEEKIKLKLTKNSQIHIVTKKSFGINSSKAIKFTRNKKRVTNLLKKKNIPTIKEIEIKSMNDLKTLTFQERNIKRSWNEKWKEELTFPLVLKPSEGQKAHNVYVGIKDMPSLKQLLNKHLLGEQGLSLQSYKDSPSQKYSKLILQQFIKGKDLRFFVLNGKVIGIVQRHPPTLTGSGKKTIKQLILDHNQHLLKTRKEAGKRMQNRLLNWPRIIWHIENQDYKMSTILPQGKTITVYPISNFQAGGTVETIPLNKVDHSIISLAEEVTRITGLAICGVDMIINTTKMNSDCQCAHCECIESYPIVLEVNSDPSLRLHEWPNKGKSQPVTKKLLEFIFKK